PADQIRVRAHGSLHHVTLQPSRKRLDYPLASRPEYARWRRPAAIFAVAMRTCHRGKLHSHGAAAPATRHQLDRAPSSSSFATKAHSAALHRPILARTFASCATSTLPHGPADADSP